MGSNIIGQVLENQFRVDAFIDSGAMGAVYRVWDLNRSVPLAMKVLHVDLADDPSMLKHFRREANALKKLTHPNIVPFYGLFQTEDFIFLLELFIDGSSLKDHLRSQRGEPLDLKTSLSFLKALCAALGYAHLHEVVHCDVKPGNVLIDRGGQIFLTDFGIARHAEGTATTFASAGTTAYMAPEQIRGESVSPATDVYALGILLFEMLTGQRPFRGSDAGSDSSSYRAAEHIRYAHLNLAPPNPRKLNPGLPEELAYVVLKALSKQPELRYQTTYDMLNEAVAAAGLTPDQIPDRIAYTTPASASIAAPMAAATLVGSSVAAPQGFPSIEPAPTPTVEPGIGTVAKPKSRRNYWLIGCLVIAVGAILCTAIGTASSFFIGIPPFSPGGSENAHAPDTQPPTQPIKTALATQKSNVSTQAPTSSLAPPESTPTKSQPLTAPPTWTSLPPTATTAPIFPEFTALQDMFCREGPDVNYEARVAIQQGEILPVLRRWSSGHWILVGIDRTDTRTRCCWVAGEGNLNVDVNSIPAINYLPDRISCELSP